MHLNILFTIECKPQTLTRDITRTDIYFSMRKKAFENFERGRKIDLGPPCGLKLT